MKTRIYVARVVRSQDDKVNEYIAHRQREAQISQKAFCTLHIRYMFAVHALAERYMRAQYRHFCGVFYRKAQSHIVDARPMQ